jgi:hypothetical protein
MSATPAGSARDCGTRTGGLRGAATLRLLSGKLSACRSGGLKTNRAAPLALRLPLTPLRLSLSWLYQFPLVRPPKTA